MAKIDRIDKRMEKRLGDRLYGGEKDTVFYGEEECMDFCWILASNFNVFAKGYKFQILGS